MIKIGDLVAYPVAELAKMLNLHERTVRVMLRDGRLKGKKLGHKWYVTEETLKLFFNEPDIPEEEDEIE